MRFLAIFDGLFFAWQWWEIALFKGKNRFAVGGVKATRLSNRLQPRATRSLRASLVHSLDQSPVHGGTVNKELLRTVTNTTRAAQQGAWATRFDLPPAPRCASGAFGMDTTRRHIEQLSVNGNFSVLMRHPDGATGFA